MRQPSSHLTFLSLLKNLLNEFENFSGDSEMDGISGDGQEATPEDEHNTGESEMGVSPVDKRVNPFGLADPPWRGLVSDRQWVEVGRFCGMTERESQVCRLLFQGFTRDNVAKRLNVKFSTVRQHTENIHAKLRVSSRAEMALRIIQIRDQLNEVLGQAEEF